MLHGKEIINIMQRTICRKHTMPINPLLHRLFLDHDIISYFLTTLKKFKKKLIKVLNPFENIMENGAFAPNKQMLHFP